MNKNSSFSALSIFLIFFVFLFFTSCYENPTHKLFEKENLINEVTKRASKRIHQELGLRPFGDGAQAMNEIKMLALAFILDKTVDVSNARKILYDSSKIFLEEINKEEKIRPYLSNYPYEIKNLEIRIFVNRSYKNDLAFLCMLKGVFYYRIHEDINELPVTVLKETYDEALSHLFPQDKTSTYSEF